jgi:hypothetical protein
MEETMKLNTLLAINAVVAVIFGLGFVLIPETLLSFYGVSLSAAGLYLGRLLGGAFLGYGILSWLVRDGSGHEMRAIVLALFVSEIIGFVITVFYQLQGVANALGWSTAAIYLLLGAAFGYHYFKMR